jgi:D-galactarolactone cycloisomerase
MPKIVRLDVVPLDYVLPGGRAYGTARGLNYRRTCSLITLETDAGVVGIGDAAGPVGAIREYLALLAPFFVGRRLYDFEIVAAQVRHKLYHFGVQNHLTSCLGGINIAVYDAIGKTLGLPVYDLLGGKSADRLPCYATTGYFVDDPTAEIEAQLATLARGPFAGVKIKIGASPASDLERVRIARRILGDDILLMVDINGNYTVDIALDSLRRIEPFDIHWCEEPLPPTDIRGYAELRARSPIRLSAGEAHYTALDFKALVDARAVDILQPSIISGGGFGEAKTVAALAQLNNLRLSPPCWGSAVAIAAAVHFAASLPVWPHSDRVPYPMLVEYDVSENPLRDELAINPVRLGGGGLVVPSGPGLGIELDRAVIERLRSR